MKMLLSALLVAGMLSWLGSAPAAQLVVATSPGVHLHARGYLSSRVWIPGHYEIVDEQVWVPGFEERVWIEPVFELRRDACGEARRVLISAGHFEVRCRAGHFELRSVRMWQPGRWVARGACR